MREIEFRAWFPEVGKMKKIDLCEQYADTTEYYIAERDGIIMQHTGLKDKNGMKIYEGDIILVVEDVVVENIGGYDRTEPEGRYIEVTIPEIYIDSYDDFSLWNGEVVGNIYQNPELIKQ